MSKDLNLKSLNLTKVFAGLTKKYGKHLAFAAVLAVLLVYILVVFKISRLASAEPGGDQSTSTVITIPKVDQKTIEHIQTLESNNTQLHALFGQARDNPFQ
ncbi:MAG TPA: hypothetical protein VFJ84_01965 [Candidatus Saccharimonadales bacterium]|nr:hypothetical protein [Candidatus Saccharimonadales bacterium]